ncbi:MAG: tetratricopeptide repeat protein [Alphaproteobacteria bacterium]|nr:tetratricopeptide repeat protein [Alphaproteobacteria bacterium]
MIRPPHALLILAPLLLTACGKEAGGVIPDAKAYLSSMDGPNVPTMSETLLKSAQDSEEAGNFAAAAQYYQQLAEKYPDNKEYKIALADAYRRGGDPDRALSVYDAVLGQDPSSIHAKEGKGLALLQKGDTSGAETMLSQTRAASHDWRSANALGVIAASRQDMTGARGYFEEALRASPGNASVLNNMGLSQAFNHDFDAAIATMGQAQAASVAHPALHQQVDLNTALVYASAGKLENAEAIAQRYFQGAALDNNLGFYAHLAHDDQLAKTYLNMALTQNKTFYQRAWNNLEALNSDSQSIQRSPTEKTLTIAPAETKPAETKPAEMPTAAAPPEKKAAVTAVSAPVPAAAPTPALSPAPAPVAATPPPAPTATALPMPPLVPAPESPAPHRAVKPTPHKPENGFDSLGNWVGSIFD